MDNLKTISLKDKVISPHILELVSQEIAAYYRFIPFDLQNNLLKVAIADPDDLSALEALKIVAQRNDFEIELYKIDEAGFEKALKYYDSLKQEVGQALTTLEQELSKKELTKQDAKQQTMLLAQEAPITKMVAVILKHAVDGNASDIHIEGTEKDIRVRYRVDGVLNTSLILPKKVQPAIVSRIKILSNLKIDEQRKPQDGRFQANINNRNIDFRVSTLPTANGEKVVMRVLDKSLGLQKLEDLGLLKGRNLANINHASKKPYGMILITGPTGSGKSTTLYAILKILNQEGVNIITLEDPVEYYIDGLNQSQIRPDIGYTFASGLRSILRQDPDIIMVGEIRDRETAELAVHAALTGHVVLSSLHTNNALGAIPRLIDMGIEPFLLASALNIVVGQRLVRKISETEGFIEMPLVMEKMINQELDKIPLEQKQELKIELKKKLPKAKNLQGRVGIFETLLMTHGLEKIIIENATESAIQAEARDQGMTSMRQDGIIKVLQGVTTLEEVLRTTDET